MSSVPLAGIKIVEFARILAGPWAGQILADLGAEVVKVESPHGDDTRKWGPPSSPMATAAAMPPISMPPIAESNRW